MSKDSRISGIWWKSDAPEKRVSGDLLVDQGKLELNGSFDGMKPGVYGAPSLGLRRPFKDKTIQGVARNGGKLYTLEYFDEPSFTSTMPHGYKADTYHLGRMFKGEHLLSTHDLSFSRYYVEVPHLLAWVGESLISVKTTFVSDNPLKMGHSVVKIEPPRDILVYSDRDSMNISFTLAKGGLSMSQPLDSVNVSQRCLLKIESENGIGFDDALGVIRQLCRLISIGVGRPISPISVEMINGVGPEASRVDLLNVSPDGSDSKSLHPADMNFTFGDIKNDSQVLFSRWLKGRSKHADAYDLLSTIQLDKPRTINNRFLEIISAIEGYVRVEKNKLGMNLQSVLKTLNEYLPKEDRLLDGKDYERLAITRNKISHIALDKPEDNNKVMSDEEKFIAVYKLRVMLEYAILSDLGMKESTLAAFYSKKKQQFI